MSSVSELFNWKQYTDDPHDDMYITSCNITYIVYMYRFIRIILPTQMLAIKSHFTHKMDIHYICRCMRTLCNRFRCFLSSKGGEASG